MSNPKKGAKKFLATLQEDVRECEALRKNKDGGFDITLAEFIQEKHQLSMEGLYEDIAIDPTSDTIQNLVNMPDSAYRWLIPEIYRDALRLGYRRASIYPNLIAGEQSVSQTSITMPAINMSDAAPRKVGVAETISIGEVSFDSKSVKISKIGRGIKVPDEVIQYVSLNLVSIFLQDFGVKMGMGLDSLAMNALINGDQANGSDSAAVVGIKVPGTLAYKDLLKIWARGARLGKNFTTMIAGEDMGVDTLDMLATTRVFGEQRAKVNIKTPIPNAADMYIHGRIANNQILVIDPATSLIKLNAQPLLVETDRIISNQVNETYATITTGFATIFRDSRVILDRSLDFSAAGFPTWMNPVPFETVTFD